MEATATDSLSDTVSTLAVLLAMLIGKWTGLAVDGYVGLVVALFILFSAYKAAKETLSPLLGRRPTRRWCSRYGISSSPTTQCWAYTIWWSTTTAPAV